ncbi:MAG: helix-turn-helix domain-containing protein, partial [Candidatus Pacebacteria bacterium]|nr:helix-turn-helix domain-containing protein [Candidatus Paceibacterota bacterium]
MLDHSMHKQIGTFIKMLRKEKKMTQAEFAEKLETSQSAVARIESGNQNLTTKELVKISRVLGENIIALNNYRRDDFRIRGGKKLHGSIETNTSKNGALGLMCASLLNKGTTVLHGIPHIEEINRIIELFESIGVEITWVRDHSIKIKAPKRFNFDTMNTDAAKKIRSALMAIGALVHDHKSFTLPHAGGCNMGERTISAHRMALESFGVTVHTRAHDYLFERTTLHASEFTMYEGSDTGTINALIAAARIPKKSIIHFAQYNYMVQDVVFFLQKLGVRIDVVEGKTIHIHGVKNITVDVEHHNSEDPIESMMFISAAATTKSELTITRCPIDFLRLELLKFEKMGLRFTTSKEYTSHNKKTKLVDITVFPSTYTALSDKIHALPYPGINTDNLPFFVPVATQAKGVTLIHDWMWENRAIYFAELNRLGAHIEVADPHRVFVHG